MAAAVYRMACFDSIRTPRDGKTMGREVVDRAPAMREYF